MIYVYIYIYIYMYPCKNQKKMGVSAKTATKQMANNGRCKKEAWQYRELGSAHGIVLGFLRGRGCSQAFIFILFIYLFI